MTNSISDLRSGPDTCDLAVRVGIHSGPVTAGVLRGDRARFQLFGDTINTTARIETTSEPGMIHLSTSTADLLIEAGMGPWVKARSDKVSAKGKGDMQYVSEWREDGADKAQAHLTHNFRS